MSAWSKVLMPASTVAPISSATSLCDSASMRMQRARPPSRAARTHRCRCTSRRSADPASGPVDASVQDLLEARGAPGGVVVAGLVTEHPTVPVLTDPGDGAQAVLVLGRDQDVVVRIGLGHG